MSIESREHVRPVEHVPGHCPPQPSLWPQRADGGQLGTHTQLLVVVLHA